MQKLEIYRQLVEDKFRNRKSLAESLDRTSDLQHLKNLPEPEYGRELDRLKERQGAIVRELSRRYSTDDFESLKQLGVGAFGVVTLVRCKRTGDQFALKQIRKDAMLKKNHRDRVLAERTLLSELRTEWVVTLHRTFQDQQYLYMVMEYLPGGDFMSHLLRLDSLSEDVTRFYMAELVEAVHAVHRLGFIHRDIKPDNIVLTKSGHLKLIDFGLCKFDPSVRSDAIASDERLSRSSPGSALPAYRRLAKSSRSQLKSSVGTPQYMAPETMTKHYDHTSDFWSVGMIAYECLMGGTPFFDEDAESRPGGKQDVHRILHKVSNYKEFLQIPFPGKNISSEATSFLRGLLCDPSVRMRYDQIRSHAFFRGIGWSRLHQLTAPIVPAGEENNRPSNKSPQLPLYRPSGMKKDPNLDFVGYTFNRFC